MARPPTRPESSKQIVASNRQARRDFDIGETVEAGVVLRGSEVKSLRESRVTLQDAYARIEDGEAWLVGLHIGPYSRASDQGEHVAERRRKLLLHRREIDRLRLRVDQERVTLVPLSLYFRDGRAKLEIGVGKGRKTFDKRQVIAERDAARDAEREMAHRRRR